MSRAARTLRHASSLVALAAVAALTVTVAACSSATGGPAASPPPIGGRGGTSTDPSVAPSATPDPTTALTPRPTETSAPTSTPTPDRVSNLNEFTAALGALDGFTCGEPRPAAVGMLVRCEAVEPGTNVAYRFSAIGTTDRLDAAFARALAPAGGAIDDARTAAAFEWFIAVVMGDPGHPATFWARDNIDEMDSELEQGGYRMVINLPDGVTDQALGRELDIFLTPGQG